MSRCVIIGGGELADLDRIKKLFCDGDFIIACDAGFVHTQNLNITPHLLVGDFDSIDVPETDVETIVLPTKKDDTDSFFALKEAIKRGFDSFLLLGMTGGRLDHTLCAVSMLEYLLSRGLYGEIIDDTTRIRVTDSALDIDPSCRYFSVFAKSTAHGVTIKNAKYCLDNADISADYQYGISNEPLANACVSVADGRLIIMEIYDVSR